jgi:ABC-2 type transport system permease protein
LRALLTLGRRDFVQARSYRTALAFDLGWGVVNVLVYYFISKVFPQSGGLGKAPSYFAFAFAGILVSLVVSSTASDVASKLREEQLTGTLEMLVAQPLRSAEIALGAAVFPTGYALARVVLYVLVAVSVLDLRTGETRWTGVVLILVLSTGAFLALGIAAAAAVLVLKKVAVVDVAIFAMTFVSGALFPLSVLPGWLQAVGRDMPTEPAFAGMRAGLYGGSYAGDAAILAGVGLVGVPISLLLFARALAYAKRRGTISEY